jgi:16S rRNA (adenine1518-N6/adenine1519-N6)-dimethyltransferase
MNNDTPRDKHAPRKRFGQHFLHDPNVIDRIVRAIAPQSAPTLVEIGPGLGAITAPLLQQAKRLHVVELDRDVIPLLQDHCAGLGELIVHQVDALRFDFQTLATAPQQLRVVGNLPYNITTPLLFHLIDQHTVIEKMIFMVQKEVADRICATANDDDYGRLSVMVQYRCKTEKLFHVGPGAFRPPPKVDSAVIRLTPHRPRPYVANDEILFGKLVNQAFSQRRKTLRNAIKLFLTADQIANLDIDPTARPETLTVEQFVRLSNATQHA